MYDDILWYWLSNFLGWKVVCFIKVWLEFKVNNNVYNVNECDSGLGVVIVFLFFNINILLILKEVNYEFLLW